VTTAAIKHDFVATTHFCQYYVVCMYSHAYIIEYLIALVLQSRGSRSLSHATKHATSVTTPLVLCDTHDTSIRMYTSIHTRRYQYRRGHDKPRYIVAVQKYRETTQVSCVSSRVGYSLYRFYSAAALLAIQSAVIPTAIQSVRLSHGGTLSRRMNTGSRGLHCEVP